MSAPVIDRHDRRLQGKQLENILLVPHKTLKTSGKSSVTTWKVKTSQDSSHTRTSLNVDVVTIGRVHLRGKWPYSAMLRVLLLAQDMSDKRHVCGSRIDATCMTPNVCIIVRALFATALARGDVSRIAFMRAQQDAIVALLDTTTPSVFYADEADALQFAQAVAFNLEHTQDVNDILKTLSRWMLRFLNVSNDQADVCRQMQGSSLRTAYIRCDLTAAGITQRDIALLMTLRQTRAFVKKGIALKFDVESMIVTSKVNEEADEEEEEEDEDEEDEEGDNDEDHISDNEDQNMPDDGTAKSDAAVQVNRRELVGKLLQLYKISSRWDLQALAFLAPKINFNRKNVARAQLMLAIEQLASP